MSMWLRYLADSHQADIRIHSGVLTVFLADHWKHCLLYASVKLKPSMVHCNLPQCKPPTRVVSLPTGHNSWWIRFILFTLYVTVTVSWHVVCRTTECVICHVHVWNSNRRWAVEDQSCTRCSQTALENSTQVIGPFCSSAIFPTPVTCEMFVYILRIRSQSIWLLVALPCLSKNKPLRYSTSTSLYHSTFISDF